MWQTLVPSTPNTSRFCKNVMSRCRFLKLSSLKSNSKLRKRKINENRSNAKRRKKKRKSLAWRKTRQGSRSNRKQRPTRKQRPMRRQRIKLSAERCSLEHDSSSASLGLQTSLPLSPAMWSLSSLWLWRSSYSLYRYILPEFSGSRFSALTVHSSSLRVL